MNGLIDLVVLVADTDAEWTIRTLLKERYASLGIAPIQFDVKRYPGRDSGVYKDAHEFLRIYLGQARHAMVILDREGSGKDHLVATEIEVEIEARLRKNGWEESQATAIVLDPELEIWVWSPSIHVPQVLHLSREQLEQVLAAVPRLPNGKPERPKETLLKALRRSARPFSASIFQELAKTVSLRVHERAFDKFRDTLRAWFPLVER